MTATTDASAYTHTAYLFIRTAARRGKVIGYWKDGGRFRLGDDNAEPFAFIDMMPRGGWDGRIRFVKIGDPSPGSEYQTPGRPGDADADNPASGEDQSEDDA